VKTQLDAIDTQSERIREQVAALCGWTWQDWESNHQMPYWKLHGKMTGNTPPNYLNDLNAMAQSEELLFPVHVSDLSLPDKFTLYRMRLEQLCVGHPGGVIRATARQRAEAFILAMGGTL
jgi:hypothetical protein